LNSEWREIYPVSFLTRVFLYNTLIASGLSLVNLLVTKDLMLNNLIVNFIFSHSIGWWLAIPLQYITKRKRHLSPLQVSLLIVFILLVAGSIGAMSAYYILFGLLYPEFPHWPAQTALTYNLILASFFGLLGVIYFNLRHNLESTITQLKQKEIEEARLIQLQKTAELDALRARIDPHFLFNTFNSIASLIRINPEMAETMVAKLSGLFRFSLRSSDRKYVRLEEELQIVRYYLEIEKLRFGERLTFQIECPEKLYHVLVPPLLIQPIVENCVKHGIQPKKNGGIINITCEQIDQKIALVVSDNGPGFSPEKTSLGYGLRSVRERLDLLYQQNQSFKIETGNSTQIQILLPIDHGLPDEI
jgi:sensor histidine kinase YesM